MPKHAPNHGNPSESSRRKVSAIGNPKQTKRRKPLASSKAKRRPMLGNKDAKKSK